MNKSPNLQAQASTPEQDVPPALLFEMIRSFVTLASTLNLSHAIKDLGSTRQTVRRHITQLETTMDGPLFALEERQYRLTELGVSVLPGAKDILARGSLWLRGQARSVGQLQHLQAKVGDWEFYQEQQSLGQIWSGSSILLRETFRAWSMSGGEIENLSFAHVRPYVIIYRHTDVGWICVEFGQKSVYVNWFGQDYARSSIGRPISKMPAGEEFSHLIDEAFHEVEAAQMARLDHVFTFMPRGESEKPTPIAYQRLIFSGSFPDKSPAVISLVVPADQVNISGLDLSTVDGLDVVQPLDFTSEDAIFENMLTEF